MPRNYKRERQLYYGYGPASSVTPEQRKHRAEKAGRDSARAKLKAEGVDVKGKDVHHKNGNALDNSRENLEVMSVKKNRSKKK